MTKKEFTARRPSEYNQKSDVELIEYLDTGTLTTAERDVIKAILDKRAKRVIQYLTEVIQKNNLETAKYNKRLIALTIVIAILTFLMLAGLLIQVWIVLR